jgi:hypothetical protein
MVAMCHDYDSSLGRFFPFLLDRLFDCTILRPGSTTPGITCDSKSPTTDRPGPPVSAEISGTMSHVSRAWPSPLWAHNTFSYVLLPSCRPVSFPYSIPFYSVPFHPSPRTPMTSSISIRFYSILFRLPLCLSPKFHSSLVISETFCI